MNNYKEFLNTLIQSGNIGAIEALVDHVLPMLDESALGETRDLMDGYMSSAPHKAIVDLIASKIGVTEETSSAYLLARIADPSLDRVELGQHVQNLKGLSGHILTTAIFKGDVQIVRALHDSHAHRYPVNFGFFKNLGPCVDGKEVKANQDFTSFGSAADVEYIFSVLMKAGLEQLLGRNNDGSAWILGKNLREAVFSTRGAVVAPQIPTLSRGQVSQPELALALCDRRSGSPYPEMYNKILVWVDSSQAHDVPGTPLLARRTFTMGPEPSSYPGANDDPSEEFGLEEYGAVMKAQKPYRQSYGEISGERAFRGFFVGLDPSTETRVDINLSYDLAQYMLTARQRLGLDAPAGKTLVLMDLDTVLGYDISQVSDTALEAAQLFAAAYFPLETLISLRDKSLVMAKDAIPCDLGLTTEQESFGRNLFSKLADPEMAGVVSQLVPRPILENYFDQNALAYGQDARDVVKAMAISGFSLGKDSYTLTKNKAISLNEAGIRFAEVSDQGFTKRAAFDTTNDRTEESYLAAMQMGLWPGKSNEMALSIKDALTLAMRLKQDLEYPALLKLHGAQAVAPFIKTEPQMKLFERVFPAQEIRDCLQLLPKKMRETVFAGDLGL
ncbi:hypothetical protein IFT69_15875 [Pseudomonas putida]|nr:hypothetical protein [Pseudomonas putida]